MDWLTASVEVPAKGCPAACSLGEGQVLDCLRPGAQSEPAGHLDGPVPSGWQCVASNGKGSVVRCPAASCAACPLMRLPDEAVLLGALVHRDRIVAEIAVPDRGGLLSVTDALAAQGGRARIVRLGHTTRRSRRALVDLGRLTEKQVRALRVASAAGLFAPGSNVTLGDVARRMGCSRSTLHEHVQKALAVLVEEAVGTERARAPRR